MGRQKMNNHPVLRRSTFEAELLECRGALLAFAYSLTRSKEKAEDLSQDTYLKAILNQDKFTPGTNLRAWLFTMMRNMWLDHKRKYWRESSIDQKVGEGIQVDGGYHWFEEEQQIAYDFVSVVPFLAYLSQDYCDSVIAVHYLGLSYEETAFVLNTKVGTVKSRVRRALEKINYLSGKDVEIKDLTLWATATKDVAKGDIYFPIAKAYEDMYMFISSRVRLPTVK